MKSTTKRKIIRPTPEEDRLICEGIANDPDTWELTAEDFANMVPGNPFTIRALLALTFREFKADIFAWFSRLDWSWAKVHGKDRHLHSHR